MMEFHKLQQEKKKERDPGITNQKHDHLAVGKELCLSGSYCGYGVCGGLGEGQEPWLSKLDPLPGHCWREY